MCEGEPADVYRYRHHAIAFLAGLLFAGFAGAQGSATLTWTPPTANTDGSPLTNLSGYRAYWGTAPGQYNQSADLPNPGLTSYVVAPLDAGQWYFVVTTLATNGNESSFSNMASKTIVGSTPPLVAPGPVRNLAVTPVENPPPVVGAGFSFRATSGFVEDLAGTAYVLRSDRYPTTRGGGRTFGWENDVETRDRSSTAPVALAGVHQLPFTWGLSNTVFRVDVEPGRYRVRWALGDMAFANRAFFEVRDGSTLLLAVPDTAVPAGQFLDATLVARTAANWPTQNAAREFNFATGQARFVLRRPASGSSVVSHLSLERL